MNNYLNKLHIVVADSNRNMMKLTKQTLLDLEIADVFECQTSYDVLKALNFKLPDILIISWDLRPQNGLELTNFIRKDKKSPSPYLPIIMSSEVVNTEQVFMARDAGINEFLVRPFSNNSLLSRIKAIIENPRPFVKTKDFFGPDRRRKQIEEFNGPERRGKKLKTLSQDKIAELLGQKEVNDIFKSV